MEGYPGSGPCQNGPVIPSGVMGRLSLRSSPMLWFRVALKSVLEWKLKRLNPMISTESAVLSGRSGRPLALYSPHAGLVAHGTAFGVSALSGDDRFRREREWRSGSSILTASMWPSPSIARSMKTKTRGLVRKKPDQALFKERQCRCCECAFTPRCKQLRRQTNDFLRCHANSIVALEARALYN